MPDNHPAKLIDPKGDHPPCNCGAFSVICINGCSAANVHPENNLVYNTPDLFLCQFCAKELAHKILGALVDLSAEGHRKFTACEFA